MLIGVRELQGFDIGQGIVETAGMVLEYLQTLLWPGIAITAILIFKKQLQQLLTNIGTAVHRVKKFSAPGTTVELIEDLRESTDQVIPTEPPRAGGLGHGTGTLNTEPGEESIDALTTGKVIRIWAEIDSSLEELVNTRLPPVSRPPGRSINPSWAINELARAGFIAPSVAENLMEARTIRNQVVHGRETIPLGAFTDYLDTISKLSQYLKDIIDLF